MHDSGSKKSNLDNLQIPRCIIHIAKNQIQGIHGLQNKHKWEL
jgi:hypothetical protein